MDRQLLDAYGNPIRYHYDELTEETTLQTTQDCEPILEENKRLQNEGDGYSPSREMRRIGSIPWTLALQWAQAAGLDPIQFCRMPRREQVQFLLRHLRSSDWRHCRTSGGNI